jgi:hypothetical protein
MNLMFMARTGFPVLRGPAPPQARAEAERGLPPFVRELNIGDMSALWSVSAEEHYLRLKGSFGERLIRHRFGAAIGQLPPDCGVQVHRSHWVAFGRVARIEPGRAQLELVDGTVIPVSRSYRRAVGLVEARLLRSQAHFTNPRS